jgi:hypothetical protein
MNEYQKKRAGKVAIRKDLILKEIRFEQQAAKAKSGPGERKAGANSRAPNIVIYRDKYITNYKIVKSDFLFPR